MATRGKGEGSIYKDETTGLWTASIELPPLRGKRRRKVIRRKNKRDVVTELTRLRGELEKRGDLPTASMTVEQWFDYWLRTIVTPHLAPNTTANYRNVTVKYIVPTIGKTKLDKVAPASVRRVHEAVRDAGMSGTYALNVHRIMSSAFEAALRENHTSRNPARLVIAPKKTARELEILDLEEGIRVLGAAAAMPNGARWATALLTGARRGEVIGVQLDRVVDELDLSWQLQRIIWTHGCGAAKGYDDKGRPAFPCGSPRGTDCPERRINVPDDYERRHLTGGLYLTRPKSKAGWRIIPLVDPLRSMLERHVDTEPPNPWGLVFTSHGHPLDPDQDSNNWRDVLRDVGIEKDVRLHDVRHTTVDLLYAAGVPEDIIMRIIGHSQLAQTRDYRKRLSPSERVRIRDAMVQFSQQFMPTRDDPDTPRALEA